MASRKPRIKRNEAAEAITVQQAFEQFIEQKMAENLSEQSIWLYRRIYKDFHTGIKIDPEIHPISEISVSDIYHYINVLKNRDLAKASINSHLTTIRAFLYWCMDSGRKYIAEPFKITLIRGQEEAIKFFTEDELELLMEKPKKGASFTEWRGWMMTNWVLGTAHRVGTMKEIQMKDLDFHKKEIIVNQQKNKQFQIIPMSPALEICLKEYIRMWRNDAEDDDYLFCNISGEKPQNQVLQKGFAKYANDRGVERTSIHSLRHTYAREFIKNGGNPMMLQKMLNHSSLEMTKRYVALFSEDLRDVVVQHNPLDNLKRRTRKPTGVKRSRF